MKQKTLFDLLGPYQATTDEVAGRFIVRDEGEGHFRVLWAFDTDAKARAGFVFWQRGE